MNALRPILLVEDNLNDIELTLAALKRNHVANEIIVTRHGGEALDFLFRHGEFQKRGPCNPVVVFLDLKMPKVDGLEVLRQMKGNADLRVIPVVMLTSSREEGDLVRSYQLGANAYMVKPADYRALERLFRTIADFWNAGETPTTELESVV